MSPESRTEIVQTLEDGRQQFVETVRDLTEAEAQAHPQEGRWSVLECVEHVTTVEERFLGRIEKAQREGAPPVNREHEAELAARVKDRTMRAQAPDFVRPTGRFQTLAEAVDAFHAVRGRTIGFAEQNAGELYSLAEAHPRFGPLNGMEFLIMMNSHVLRHAAQVSELRAELRK
ncbi:MAG TPA: DinB family protein [Bryobacteraceae bacterium]|jgi:hypothetical protein